MWGAPVTGPARFGVVVSSRRAGDRRSDSVHQTEAGSRCAARIFIAAILLVLPLMLPAQAPLLEDDFDDGVIDSALWRVSLPFSNALPSSAAETGGGLVLFRRGGIDSLGTFAGSLDIQGKFRFTGDNDTLSVVFRSDLTVTNQAERRGVQAALQESTGRVFLIPEPFASTPTSGVFMIAKNQDVTFRITDNGDLVKLYLNDLFFPVMSVAITNRRGSHVSLYNSLHPAGRAQVDHFSVRLLLTSIFIDDQLIHEGPVSKATALQVKFQPFYTNSQVYYTLDGTEPSFVSTEYTGPFTIAASATIRAISYRADFLDSTGSPAIEVQVVPEVTLTNETLGGGIVQFDPPGPTHFSNTVVSMTAVAAPGWQFLRWDGAVGGRMTSNSVTMTNHLAVRAVFGTGLTLSSIGSGQVQTHPPGPIHAYGSRVRVMAVPSSGSYFIRWANSLAGNSSPGTLVVTNAAPGISALFSGLVGDQVSLTLLVDGFGTVSLSPAMNVFTNDQSVTLTALPDIDQVFLGWTGDASDSTNPLRVMMDASKTLTARFAPGVKFQPALSKFDTNGFLLLIRGQPGFAFGLQASSDLLEWDWVATLTNVDGNLLYQHHAATNQPMLFYRVVAP